MVRGSPVTERRQKLQAVAMAAATVAPAGTRMLRPFTVNVISSGICVLQTGDPRWQIRFNRDGAALARKLIGKQPGSR